MADPAFSPLPPQVVVDVARSYAVEALQTLVRLMKQAESESVQLAAAKAILGHAYGRTLKAAPKVHEAPAPSRISEIPAAPQVPEPADIAQVPPLAAQVEEEAPPPPPMPTPTAKDLRRAWRLARGPEARAAVRAEITAFLNSDAAPGRLNGAAHAPPRA